jgi:hypothetical protein
MPALPSPEAELYHGGQGGHFVKAFGGATPIVVAVAEWQAGKRARLADTTTSASGGERRQKVLGGASVRINVPWNEGAPPEILGLGAGSELVDVTLIFGESGWHYPSFTMIVESLDVVCNQTDIIRVTISGYCQGELGDPVAPTP